MNQFKIITLLACASFFSACQETTTTASLVDISSIYLTNKTVSFYPTDKSLQMFATVTYKDSSTVDATNKVDWLSSNINLFTVSNGKITAGILNGGDANVSIAYKKYSDSTSVHFHKLTAFHLQYPDINSSGTGSYLFSAYGDFDNGETNRSIANSISWSFNGQTVTNITDGIATIDFLTGESNVTATMFGETNSSSPIAPITVKFQVN